MIGEPAAERATLRDRAIVNSETAPYDERVGAMVRTWRRARGLSLREVEELSYEFKASIVGAYERGDRALTVPRLAALARFYGVDTFTLPGFDAGDDVPPPTLSDVAKLIGAMIDDTRRETP